MLTNRTPFTPCPVYDLGVNLESEKPEAIAWMRKTFSLADDVDLIGLNSLAQDPRMIRGKEYWRLGLYEEARAEFENLRLDRELDAVDTFRLTQFFLDLGVYRSAVFSARQVLTLGGMDDNATFNAPVYFNHIRFGAYYREIIVQAAKEEDLDPLLLLSLVRQESLFEGFIQSSAGANGLMQILPATARETSANMGWPPVFLDQDIYRPYINLRLGSHYLRQQIDYQNGDMYAALAGYNSGPGNAQIWGQLSNGDPDLYLEVVRYQETRLYIRSIVELFNIYKMFYCRAQ
jgi:soluble lytic murein transglycosylase